MLSSGSRFACSLPIHGYPSAALYSRRDAMSASNKVVARRIVEEIWNNRHLQLADELVAPSFMGGGPEAYKQAVHVYLTAFPDLHCEIQDMMAEDDKVVTRWRFTATHEGDLLGIAATWKRISVNGVTISRIRDGKVLEEWVSWDMLSLMRQLGVLRTLAVV
jgi:steroid delta-isomerase-like uncharacterized protein